MDHGVVRELGRIEPGHGERHLGGEERRVAEGRVSRGGGGVGGSPNLKMTRSQCFSIRISSLSPTWMRCFNQFQDQIASSPN